MGHRWRPHSARGDNRGKESAYGPGLHTFPGPFTFKGSV